MGPDNFTICGNDNITASTVPHGIFNVTCNNPPSIEALEADMERVKEIQRLENMMRESSMHEDNKHARQHMELHCARLATMKHKKPHMTRRIIR